MLFKNSRKMALIFKISILFMFFIILFFSLYIVFPEKILPFNKIFPFNYIYNNLNKKGEIFLFLNSGNLNFYSFKNYYDIYGNKGSKSNNKSNRSNNNQSKKNRTNRYYYINFKSLYNNYLYNSCLFNNYLKKYLVDFNNKDKNKFKTKTVNILNYNEFKSNRTFRGLFFIKDKYKYLKYYFYKINFINNKICRIDFYPEKFDYIVVSNIDKNTNPYSKIYISYTYDKENRNLVFTKIHFILNVIGNEKELYYRIKRAYLERKSFFIFLNENISYNLLNKIYLLSKYPVFYNYKINQVVSFVLSFYLILIILFLVTGNTLYINNLYRKNPYRNNMFKNNLYENNLHENNLYKNNLYKNNLYKNNLYENSLSYDKNDSILKENKKFNDFIFKIISKYSTKVLIFYFFIVVILILFVLCHYYNIKSCLNFEFLNNKYLKNIVPFIHLNYYSIKNGIYVLFVLSVSIIHLIFYLLFITKKISLFYFWILTLFAGFIIHFIPQTNNYSYLFIKNHFVVFMYFYPFLVLFYIFYIYIYGGFKYSANKNKFIKHFMVFVFDNYIIVLFLLIYFVRIFIDKPFPFEIKIRNFLENIFFIRPRFKEIIFYPILLIIARMNNIKFFNMINSNMVNSNKMNFSKINSNNIYPNNIYIVMLIFGYYPVLSFLNSSYHVHTPFYITIYRTFIVIAFYEILYIMFKVFNKIINYKKKVVK